MNIGTPPSNFKPVGSGPPGSKPPSASFSGPQRMNSVQTPGVQQQPPQQPVQPQQPAQQQPPVDPQIPNMPPPRLSPEQLAEMSRRIEAAKRESGKMAEFLGSSAAFEFACSFFEKTAGFGLSADETVQAIRSIYDQNPTAGEILVRFSKAAAYTGNVVGYKVDKPESKRNKVVLGNQLWLRRKKKEKGLAKEAVRVGRFLTRTAPAIGAGTGAGTTPLFFDEETERADLLQNMAINALAGAGVGGGFRMRARGIRDARALKARPGLFASAGSSDVERLLHRLGPSARVLGGDTLASTGTLGLVGTNMGFNQYLRGKRLDAAATDEQARAALASQDASRAAAEASGRQADAAGRQIALAEEQASTARAERRNNAIRTGAIAVGGIGALGLGAYGIYGVIRNILDRRENKNKPSGMIRLTLPRADGREVLVEVPKAELPMYMQRQLGTDLRRSVRTGLEDRRRQRRGQPNPDEEDE